MLGKKTGGRKKGTPNKVSADVKKMIQKFITENFDEFVECWKNLPPTSPVKFNTIIQLSKIILTPSVLSENEMDEKEEAVRKSIEDLQKLDRKMKKKYAEDVDD